MNGYEEDIELFPSISFQRKSDNGNHIISVMSCRWCRGVPVVFSKANLCQANSIF